jgi:hypothetical protein
MEPGETPARVEGKEKPAARGPLIQENWLRAQSGPSKAYEAPIYTDARIIGMLTEGLGPYQFFNTVPTNDHFYAARPAIVFRWAHYLTWEAPKWDETNDEGYHGGSIDDEAAALLSVCLGMRAQAADLSREFGVDGDPRGLPIAYGGDGHVPTLPPIGRSQIIPSAGGKHSLDGLTLLSTIPKLAPATAVALVRAARLYQAALWISEADPNQAWILLASAVEAAADTWDQQAHSPVESLTGWNPSLVKLLQKHGGDELAQKVAEKISRITGSTRKFVSFLRTYRPPPPDVRPPTWCQLDWQDEAFERSLKTVYRHRSAALHGGAPFPAPMCWAPMRFDPAVAERSAGAAGTGSHTWAADDLPMHLHMFAYIVRHSILNWWKSCSPESPNQPKLSASLVGS